MTAREKLAGALLNVLCNASNFPVAVQPRILGQDMGPLTAKVADAILASPWLAVHDAEVKAAALEKAAADWAADPDSWGDNEKDYRNELRDRAAAIREQGTK